MRFCRLCGEYKTVEELVVSLDDPIRILQFKDVVEYYCQVRFYFFGLDINIFWIPNKL